VDPRVNCAEGVGVSKTIVPKEGVVRKVIRTNTHTHTTVDGAARGRGVRLPKVERRGGGGGRMGNNPLIVEKVALLAARRTS